MAVTRSFSDDNVVKCTSGFVDDVIFSRNGGQWGGIKDDIAFRRVRQMAAQGRSLLSTIALLAVVAHIALHFTPELYIAHRCQT